MNNAHRYYAALLALSVAAIIGLGIHECASTHRQELRYRSGEAYYECVNTCGRGGRR